LEQNRARISAQGLGLAAVSYDSVAILKTFADREHIGFELLSDPESKLIRSYVILNETVQKDSPSFGIPHPGTYVLDARGIVTAKYFEDDFRVRDTAGSILLRQFGLEPSSRAAVQAKHLQLNTSGGDMPLRPNQRVSLAVDLQLPDRMHVYTRRHRVHPHLAHHASVAGVSGGPGLVPCGKNHEARSDSRDRARI